MSADKTEPAPMSPATAATPLRLAVLISGSGSNLQALIDAQQRGELPVTIGLVISNRAEAYGLQRAQRAGIPTQVLSHRDFDSRAAYDAALAALLEAHAPELIALAGFMRILTPELVTRWQGRMLNIHPSLLPKYRGLHTHERVLEHGDDRHGATVHFVTAELDGGPAVLQAQVAVQPEDDPEQLATRVLIQEHRIYPLAVRWIAEGRLRLGDDGQPYLDGQRLTEPVILTAEG
jgi:phosphoribosylglycinamide formyltransferase-1